MVVPSQANPGKVKILDPMYVSLERTRKARAAIAIGPPRTAIYAVELGKPLRFIEGDNVKEVS